MIFQRQEPQFLASPCLASPHRGEHWVVQVLRGQFHAQTSPPCSMGWLVWLSPPCRACLTPHISRDRFSSFSFCFMCICSRIPSHTRETLIRVCVELRPHVSRRYVPVSGRYQSAQGRWPSGGQIWAARGCVWGGGAGGGRGCQETEPCPRRAYESALERWTFQTNQ